MELEKKVEQLTDLSADLVPAVDKMVKKETATHDSISKSNTGISELRLSNIKLAEVIEKLSLKIDRLDDFEKRLVLLERKML